MQTQRSAADGVLDLVAQRHKNVSGMDAKDNLAGEQVQDGDGSDAAFISAHRAIGNTKKFGEFQLRQA